jgi:hypothetical protein
MPVQHEKYLALHGKNANISDPGAGGTFKFDGIGEAIVVLTATGTYTLPDEPRRVELLICCDDTSVITVADGGGTIGSFTGTTNGSAARVTKLGDLGNNSWGFELLGDAVGEAASLSIADAGAYTATTNVETATQELFALAKPYSTMANTAISTVGAGTLTAAGIVGGLITRSGSTAAYSDTTATAALIQAAVGASVRENQTWLLYIKNTVAFNETIVGGTGVTVTGQAIVPPNSTGVFLVTATVISVGTEEVSIVGLGAHPQSTLPPSQFTTIAASANITAAAGTLTGADHCVYATTGTGACALTTRTATEMFADTPNAHIGQKWRIRIISDGDNTTTLTAGTGVTITGTAAAATNTFQEYQGNFTSATAVTFQNIGSGTVTATT